jgi:hypothetical protein
LTFELNSSEPGCDWQQFCSWENGKLIQKNTDPFYQQSPLQCPECHEDYYPAINLQGNITFSECYKCSWSEY